MTLTQAEQEVLEIIREDPYYLTDIDALSETIFALDYRCLYGERAAAVMSTQQIVNELRIRRLV